MEEVLRSVQDSLKKFIVLSELLESENLVVQSAANFKNLTKKLDKKSEFLTASLVNLFTASGGDCLLNYIFK